MDSVFQKVLLWTQGGVKYNWMRFTISKEMGTEQTRSRIWPLTWVGKETCWVRLKLSSKLMQSDANLQVGESGEGK